MPFNPLYLLLSLKYILALLTLVGIGIAAIMPLFSRSTKPQQPKHIPTPHVDTTSPTHLLYKPILAGNLAEVEALFHTHKKAGMAISQDPLPLILAAQAGDLAMARYLIHQKASIDATDSTGYTALAHAVAHGQLAMVKYLREEGASLDLTIGKDTTLLMLAAQEGHLPVVQYLDEQTVDPSKGKEKHDKAYTQAVVSGNLAVVQYFQAKSPCTPNGSYYHALPYLIVATKRGYLPIVKYLCQAGAAPCAAIVLKLCASKEIVERITAYLATQRFQRSDLERQA